MSAPAGNMYVAATLLAAVVVLVGCGGSGSADIVLSDPAIGATDSEIAAMYLTITNQGDQADSLNAATCTCAATVTLHLTDTDGGMSKMVDTGQLDLPAGGTVELDPAGSHVMLEELVEPLTEGDTVSVRFEFEHSAAQTIEVPVVGLVSLAERVGG